MLKKMDIFLPNLAMNTVKAPSTQIRFKLFSNENGAVLLRIRLSSTLQRQKRSPKTEPFENAFQSGAI